MIASVKQMNEIPLGWVYCTCPFNTGADEIKIGVTHQPESRRCQFSTGSAAPFIMGCWQVRDAEKWEAKIHNWLAPYRVRAEWFDGRAIVNNAPRMWGAHAEPVKSAWCYEIAGVAASLLQIEGGHSLMLTRFFSDFTSHCAMNSEARRIAGRHVVRLHQRYRLLLPESPPEGCMELGDEGVLEVLNCLSEAMNSRLGHECAFTLDDAVAVRKFIAKYGDRLLEVSA